MAWSVGLVIGTLVVFVAGMAWLLAILAGRLLAEARAGRRRRLGRLTELPCGVPDGTIRALISCFIIIFGFLLIGLQKPLGLASAEALTGFIGAVISFYFVTRSGETRRGTGAAGRVAGCAGRRRPAARRWRRRAACWMRRGWRPGWRRGWHRAPPWRSGPRRRRPARGRCWMPPAAALHGGNAAAIAGAAAAAAGPIRGVIGRDNPATGVIAEALAGLRGAALFGLGSLGLGGPAGLVAALGVGAFQAMARGTEHFERWKARVLDRPYTTNLFPPGPVDAAVALSALEQSPILARVCLTEALAPAERFATAARLASLARQETAAAQQALLTQGGFASADEAAAGLEEFRGRLLDQALDAVDAAPIDLAPAGVTGVAPVPQQALRDALAKLRRDPHCRDLDSLVLLLTGMASSPDLKREEAMALLRHQLAAAEAMAAGVAP